MRVRYEFQPSPHAPLPAGGLQPGLIVLAGFMGTGKTRTGRALAELLGVSFLDTDEVIVRESGRSIPEIFARDGEAAFRRLEHDLCRKLARRRDLVVATGGGTLVDQRNHALLSEAGTVVLLEASPETILARVGDAADRPLLQEETIRGREDRLQRIRELLEQRATAYGRIGLRCDTDRLEPRAAAVRIAARLQLPHHTIELRWPELGTSRIAIGRGLLSRLGAELARMELGPRVMLLMAERLVPLYLDQIAAALEEAGLKPEVIPVADGDARKNLDQAARLIDRLALCGADRWTPLVTVGGGVTGDLAGFVASIYMRGMPLVHVPTTLLAQVDASIGGKVGVNHPRAKNLIGSFHQPRLVVSDPCVLRTLPDRQIAGGMAEVVKTATLGSADLFTHLEQALVEERPGRLADNAPLLERCVSECAAIKAAVVERDPLEAGERRVLNLGHTAGHALEAVGGYERVLHGEAVAVGLVIAARIACDRGLIPRGLLRRTRRLLAACGLPTVAPAVEREAFTASLLLDKKKRGGRLRYVLPAGLGVCLVVDDVTAEEVWQALEGERHEQGEARE